MYSIEKQRVKFPPKQSMNINYHDVIRFKTGEFSESHDTIQHGPRLHTIIIREVGWAFEQNGSCKNLWAAVSILSACRIRSSSVLDTSSRKARAV